jgi:hypothetical protein
MDKVSIVPDSPPGYGVEDAMITGTAAVAAQYIVDHGLVVPLRSATYRLLSWAADFTEMIPLSQGIVAATYADVALYKAKFKNHTCAP